MAPNIPTLLDSAEPALRERIVRLLPEHRLRALNRAFAEWAHPGQLPPEGDWRTWVIMAGRGYGKTRAGAEWVLGLVRGEGSHSRLREGLGVGQSTQTRHPAALTHPRPLPQAGVGSLRIALVAATADEAREVMVEGPSGILAWARPHEIRDWEPSRRLLTFASGATAMLYSGASPNKLRGPQHHFAWCDELAKWRHPGATWDMLQLGLRCGDWPRALVTTTPRGGCAALARILDDPATALTGGSSHDNPYLPEAFRDGIERLYGGTRFGREEIDGAFLREIAGSLWPPVLIEASRGLPPARAALRRVVVGVDPPASAEGTCGIVVCGLDEAGIAHVPADHSLSGASPEGWARAVAAAALVHGADRVVAEKNMGGDMVRSVLRAADAALPVTLVAATRGKVRRAEPVAGLFESAKARLAGRFLELEEQLAGLVSGGGYAGPGASPDRADAMVWALWALLLAGKAAPRVSKP